MSKILDQMSKLVRDGLVSPDVVGKMLEASGVEIVSGGKCGTYHQGMLRVGDGLQGLDPLGITAFRMPAPAPKIEEPAPKVQEPKPLASGVNLNASVGVEMFTPKPLEPKPLDVDLSASASVEDEKS